MTLTQAATILGTSPDVLRQAIARGALKAEKHGRDWWVEPAEVERYGRDRRRGRGHSRMDARGRRGRGWHPVRRGEDHQAAKLTDEQVAAVRVLRAAGWSQRRIGALLGLSHTYVGQLERGEKRVG